MTFPQFQQGLSALLSLPKEESGRALGIAEQLPEQDRIELYKYLEDLNGRFATAEQAEKTFVADAEKLLQDAEMQVGALARMQAAAGKGAALDKIESHPSQAS